MGDNQSHLSLPYTTWARMPKAPLHAPCPTHHTNVHALDPRHTP
jgi:hypothetical protein